MRIITLNEDTKKDILSNLLKRSPDNYGSYEATVKEIVEDIHINGDNALLKYTEKFGKAKLDQTSMRVTKEEIEKERQERKQRELEILQKIFD